MKKFGLMISAGLVLAACSQADNTPAAEETEAAPAPTAAVITQADGTKMLGYAAADGKAYSGKLIGDGTPAPFAVEDGKGCITLEQGKVCITFGPVGDDGTFEATSDAPDNNEPGKLKVLSKDYAAGETPAIEPEVLLVMQKDGKQSLVVFTKDKSYYAPEINTATWHQDGDKRCFKPDNGDTESCGTAGEPGEDGSFTVTPDEGDPYTVLPLPLS